MKFLYLLSLLFIIFAETLLAQGEFNYFEDKVEYRDERTFATIINTNGFGFQYWEGRHINPYKKHIFSIEWDYVKNPKEKKILSWYGGLRYSYGKINTCFELKPSYGKIFILTEKMDKGSVELRYFYNAGVSIAFLKPYYYTLNDSSKTYPKVKYTEDLLIQDIYSRGGYFKGIWEMKFLPGIFLKTGLSVDFGKFDRKINAFDVTTSLTVYPKKLAIMYENQHNSFIFFNLNIAYRFGKIYHGKHKKILNKREKEKPQP